MEVACNFRTYSDAMPDGVSGTLTVKKRKPEAVELQLQIGNKYLTLEVASTELVQVQVLECSDEFLPVAIRL